MKSFSKEIEQGQAAAERRKKKKRPNKFTLKYNRNLGEDFSGGASPSWAKKQDIMCQLLSQACPKRQKLLEKIYLDLDLDSDLSD